MFTLFLFFLTAEIGGPEQSFISCHAQTGQVSCNQVFWLNSKNRNHKSSTTPEHFKWWPRFKAFGHQNQYVILMALGLCMEKI